MSASAEGSRQRSAGAWTGLAALLLLFLPVTLPAAPDPVDIYPVIPELSSFDPLFKQLQDDIALFHRRLRSADPLPAPLFFRYRVAEGETLFSIASRANLPYDTLATLNRLSSSRAIQKGDLLLLPNRPGLYIPEEPATDFEEILLGGRHGALQEEALPLLLPDWEHSGRRRSYLYLPGQNFNPTERSFFLGILFRNPLPRSVITSGYGYRESPFTGERRFHRGIDLAAPAGTPVRASRDGQVIETGENRIFGRYIVIRHAGNYRTFYGHLQKIFVRLNQTVNWSMIIGEVGETGLSTGPHLHFEIREGNESHSPESFIPDFQR